MLPRGLLSLHGVPFARRGRAVASQAEVVVRGNIYEKERERRFDFVTVLRVWKVSFIVFDVPSWSQTHQHRLCFFSLRTIVACVHKLLQTKQRDGTP